MRRIYAITVVLALVVGLGLGWSVGTAGAAEKKVVAMMDWTPQGRHIPFHVAAEKGWYQAEGLAVEIIRGYGGAQTVAGVDQGKATFGISEITAVLLNRAKGGKVRAIGMLGEKSVIGVGGLKEAGVRTPKDLEGKKIAIAAGSPTRQVLPALCRANNVDCNKIQVVTLDPTLMVSSVLRGDAHASAVWKGSNYAVLVREARKLGKETYWIGVSDWGVDIYGVAILAHDRTLQEDADLVRRFLRATYRGVEFAMERPDEGVAILIKRTPALAKDADIVRQQWDETAEVLKGPMWSARGYGWILEDKMKRSRDVVLEAFNIKIDLPLSDYHTNEFLPGKR
ncbi:MAG: ABC transporter substrate-binding protein [Deltaproteobacteria bacterium]|nr:ABC transporter substrate-binding protein [Deltaproteobacteria bacterium]MBI3079025.1 ABC transporter substrate-binding protein [Deltaproteobacteria bacterium]